ncbi:two-component sensor histidine kinase [Merismopedia glauca CCAP 1448/3]|uniref:histidine kinase n=1 Tax=Merismopedia glauca CCAP 1448/3 TaxID=1296344 RepID=A0A2T1C0W9_9CYAN|nr:HAMP domain-containing sensor histidine kinase [Merismopedia glauca]PSB01911.1 two-component sensor histidine kinase [Merismopedia glauca CCAP 1448/3]
MSKPGLRSRLFFSHFLVMIVGVSSFVAIGKLSSPPMFVQYLEQLEFNGWRLRYARTQLVQGFEQAWSRSSVWSVIFGASTAGFLSYWLSRRIVQPLQQMEQITEKFGAGELQQRLPTTEIPELNRLATSFNRMATSLEGVEQRRRELITDLTHELRTPLTVMRGYLESLADGEIEADLDTYDRLIRETARLQRLVNDLQELSQAETGYLPIHLQNLNLRPLLELMVEKFADQILDNDPVLELKCPPQLPLVRADSDRTEQILTNLLGNALSYTQTGKITLQAWVESDRFDSRSATRLWIAVQDTGMGIPAAALPHIFERFWRTPSTGFRGTPQAQDRVSRGTGVGLAITRRLVELQGGIIEVESEEGKGSIFRFCLPLAR